MSEERRYKATVRFVMEVVADGVWGSEWTLDKVEDTASREAKEKLFNAFEHVEKPYSAPRVIGCSVEAVTVMREDKLKRK
jgi:hypothetical protein